MGKRIRDYVKYTFSELERYAKSSSSCVNKVNTPIHLNFPPYGLGNFRQTLLDLLQQKKIGFYDANLKGIILDIRNIKVKSDVAPLRYDDPAIHLNLQVDCYVFQPQVGAIVQGLVKHISDRQIGVIIYRVFSVSIRLNGRVPKNVTLNSDIEFRIKQFDLESPMPFIEGELVGDLDEDVEENASKVESTPSKKKLRFDVKIETGSSGYNSDGSQRKRTRIKPDPGSSSDSDDSVDTKPDPKVSRSQTKSPDLFAISSSSESEEEAKPAIKVELPPPAPKKNGSLSVKVKKEKLHALNQEDSSANESVRIKPQVADVEVSDIEPGQRIKIEKHSQQSHQNDIKQEMMSPPPERKTKSRKNANVAESSDIDINPRIKSEELSQHLHNSTSKVQKEKSKKLVKINDEESTPDSKSKLNLNSSVNITNVTESTPAATDESRNRQRKRTNSLSDGNISQTEGKVKKHKTSPRTTVIHIDSDFEMTAEEPAKKHKKKKKKSQEDSNDVESQVPNLPQNKKEGDFIDLENLATSDGKKKKKKLKEKDRDNLSSVSSSSTANNASFNSSLSSILAQIKAERSL